MSKILDELKDLLHPKNNPQPPPPNPILQIEAAPDPLQPNDTAATVYFALAFLSMVILAVATFLPTDNLNSLILIIRCGFILLSFFFLAKSLQYSYPQILTNPPFYNHNPIAIFFSLVTLGILGIVIIIQ